MDIPILILVAFLFLLWIGLNAINIIGAIKKPEEIQNKGGSKSPKNPKTLVIVPCKGTDLTLYQNLMSIKGQDCKNYDIIAVVDDKGDSALPEIKRCNIDYIISSKEFMECSGKVRAISTAIKKFKRYDCYVIIDSDVFCKRSHLRELVKPLSDNSIGVSTAYPYFEPKGRFWSKVKMVWGFVGNGMMESDVTRFCWGGSMAFRKGLLDKKYFAIFSKAVSDDMAIAYAAKQKGLKVHYVNKSLISINQDDDFARFSEWSTRQTALSILGNRNVLKMGVAFYGANCTLLVCGTLLSIFASPIYLILLVPFLIGLMKTFRRSNKIYASIIPIYIIINFIFLANLLVAGRKKRIEWRGTAYELRSPY